LRILVVEDNPGDLFLLQEYLRSSDLDISEVIHAERLKEAREILDSRAVDLIFLDLSLPDSYGLETYTGLQNYAQRVPVILLTGLTDKNIAPQALVMGAQDYLIKGDFDQKLLSRAIRYSLERMRNLQYLRESEERYRELFNNNPMPMWVFDSRNFHFLEANTAAVGHYGYTREEFLAKTVADIRLNGDTLELRSEVESVRGRRDGIRMGIRRHVKKSGEVIIVEMVWHQISYRNEPAILALAGDVTEKIRLEEELNEQRLSRQKQITEAVIFAQEKERTEIGKELHDNVNQILGASNLYINTAMTDEEMRQELLERSTELISSAINEIRKISKSLITPGLREIGLIESIEVIINDLKVSRELLAVGLDLQNISEDQIEDRRKLAIFRIVQEQLNNIIKHAKASRVLVRLSREGDRIVVTIEDNGVGFEAGQQRKGVGITNIISRAELFNGDVEIQSAPGEGCRLTVSLPI
ncbi:MAG TPA: response regulator, partial [Puia sp.]|nr:response regulator [Puia sp.]